MMRFALFLALFPFAAQAAPQKVLFTTFDPFGGSPANNTQAVGAELQAHPEWFASGVTIALCNLPVVYDVAPQQALDCIAKEKPDVVISLGEADCSLQVESAANNLDDTPGFPDNAGNVRENHPIIPGAPDRLGFAFPVESMMCAIDPKGDAGVIASITPDNFVCNNTAYTLAYQLPGMNLPFTFIHVPNSQCEAAQVDPQKNAQMIAKAVSAGLKALDQRTAVQSLWLPAAQDGRMPSTADQVNALLSALQGAKAPACQVEYATRLQAAYAAGLRP